VPLQNERESVSTASKGKCANGSIMQLSIGVLIIGSLYWDPRRQAWRKSRLNMDEVYNVRARIRYGRLSSGRDDTYTMVFSGQAVEGQAKVVRCRRDVSSLAELDAEANQLWGAERNRGPDGTISAEWGCVAMLCNPGRKIPAKVAVTWAKRVAGISDYGNSPHLPGETAPLSASGLLQIPWPVISGGNDSVPLDLLIATANDPTLKGNPKSYPTPEVIAAAWRAKKAAKKNRVDYFQNNVRHGIRTFEDDAIAEYLRG
jgi:hypothetical protein